MIILVMSCNLINRSNNLSHNKPKIVPDNSFWIGGVDGGQWYLIDSIDKINSIAWIKIYNDFDGKLEVNKRFVIYCKSQSSVNLDSLKDLIDGFDGKRIYLIKTDTNNKKCFLE